MKKKIFLYVIIIATACSTGINLFTDSDEVALGKKFDEEIRKNSEEYPIYDKNPELKNYIEKNIFNEILNSPEVKKRTVYNYKMEIIDNDSVLNAFAVPGGYIYIYTGLLKYLDSEAALAGVIGHEIAHVERRHATQRITAAYGISFVMSVVLGNNPTQLAELAANMFTGLALLANSRSNEDESDQYSILYLKTTRFYPGSVKFFFEKLRDDGKISTADAGIATFLSTHPDPLDRIENTEKRISEMGYNVLTYKDTSAPGIFYKEYQRFVKSKMQ
ncbi:peptidase, M48 family [Melioribacter roseus P3M-2]|uniref:Peptidase, M48 family n=1 Tax=Melioribacter roseus (strain DSM 23840 / JCM 17771 / VKM B-2668 / P3M-2) TaxID=1191523 RepID=I7A140_MELRP|nr:M48 family metalloprotease [Melioribacter roseus]AFN73696.1 peptidase, M48 family [Melioribacter roseus P3M-2]